MAFFTTVPTSQILVTLMMEALHSSKLSVLTRATQHNTAEDGIPHSHSREILKSYSLLQHFSRGGFNSLKVFQWQ
jgi:hypothetical protein